MTKASACLERLLLMHAPLPLIVMHAWIRPQFSVSCSFDMSTDLVSVFPYKLQILVYSCQFFNYSLSCLSLDFGIQFVWCLLEHLDTDLSIVNYICRHLRRKSGVCCLETAHGNHSCSAFREILFTNCLRMLGLICLFFLRLARLFNLSNLSDTLHVRQLDEFGVLSGSIATKIENETTKVSFLSFSTSNRALDC